MIQHLSATYTWLCKRRAHYCANSDYWHLQFHWQTKKSILRDQLKAGTYVFSPRQQFRFPDKTMSIYSSQDSLVLKAMNLMLSEQVARESLIHRQYYHIKDHGV